MKFWVATALVFFFVSVPAHAGFQRLSTHHTPQTWVLPSHDPTGHVIQITYKHRTFTGHPREGCKWPLRMGDIRAQVRMCFPKHHPEGRFALRYSAPFPRSFTISWR